MRNLRENYLELVDPADTVVVVLGGGRGDRLHPLTKSRAKPAVDFGGKYRLIDICLTNCLRSKLENIFILTQYNSFSLNRHVWQTYAGEMPGSGFIDIITSDFLPKGKKRPQGTADALRQALPYVLYHNPKHVLVLNGDQLYRMDYRELLLHHEICEADITVAGLYNTEDEIDERVLMRVDGDGRVHEFYARPRRADKVERFRLDALPGGRHPETKPFLTHVGVYCFRRETLIELLNNRKSNLEQHMLACAAEDHGLFAFPVDGAWEDVGTIPDFFRANMEWREGRGLASLFANGASIMTRSRHLPPSRIRNTLIEDSIIADGVDSAAQRFTRSIVGIRTRIDQDAILEDAIVMGHDGIAPERQGTIGKCCYIRKAIIDKNVTLGEHSRIQNIDGIEEADEALYTIRAGIVVIPRDTVLPPGTVI
jgi:glucose-1-phosphate adenylyltransferase